MKFIRLCSRRAPQFEESPCFWAISTLDIHMSSPMVASRPPKMEVGNNKCNKEGSRLISKENRPFPTGMIVGNGSFCGYSTYHDLVFRWPKPLYIFHGKMGAHGSLPNDLLQLSSNILSSRLCCSKDTHSSSIKSPLNSCRRLTLAGRCTKTDHPRIHQTKEKAASFLWNLWEILRSECFGHFGVRIPLRLNTGYHQMKEIW